MSIELRDPCRHRLLALLLPILDGARVVDGYSLRLAPRAELDGLNRPLGRAEFEKASEYVSDAPLSDFVYSRLAARVARDGKYEKGISRTLCEFFATTSGELADSLLQEFSSLPWKYELYVETGLEAHEPPGGTNLVYDLGEGVSLFVPGEEFCRAVQPPVAKDALSALMGTETDGEWSRKFYYIRIQVDGFVEDFVSTRPVETALYVLRTIGGLLLANPLLVTLQPRLSGLSFEEPLLTYLNGERGSVRLRSHQMPADHASVLTALVWGDLSEYHGEKWPGLLRTLAAHLAKGLEGLGQNIVARSAQWFFDSHCGQNEVLHFVQAAVAMEILLTDRPTSDLVGIQKLLANRCAYALAENREHRAEILRKVETAYSTRSKIVHSGHPQLTAQEREQLRDLQEYCGAAISNEIDLMQGQRGMLQMGAFRR